jgi:hypothetical protein
MAFVFFPLVVFFFPFFLSPPSAPFHFSFPFSTPQRVLPSRNTSLAMFTVLHDSSFAPHPQLQMDLRPNLRLSYIAQAHTVPSCNAAVPLILADEADSSVIAAPTASSIRTTKTGKASEGFCVECQSASKLVHDSQHGRSQVLV